MNLGVLVVEDDDRIRSALGLALTDDGWEVVGVGTAEEAIALLNLDVAAGEASSGTGAQPSATATQPEASADLGDVDVDAGEVGDFDIVLVDLMLPGIDGFELCRQIRRNSDMPIIMVTARDDTHDVVGGLEAGADDYLTKPFSPKELSARMRALMRRTKVASNSGVSWTVGELQIFPGKGVVLLADKEVHLTKTEFLLLCELAEADGDIRSRDELLASVWGRTEATYGRLVDVHVRRLRVKIEPDAANPTYVHTARGMGYRLAV